MSINAHNPQVGLTLYQTEEVVMQCKGVKAVFRSLIYPNDVIKGVKHGDIYLTNYRLIFVNNSKKEPFHDINMPFHLIKDFGIQQPVFGANSLLGKIDAEENGGWSGAAAFEFVFNKGGAVDIAKKMKQLADSPPQPYLGGSPVSLIVGNVPQRMMIGQTISNTERPYSPYTNNPPPPYYEPPR